MDEKYATMILTIWQKVSKNSFEAGWGWLAAESWISLNQLDVTLVFDNKQNMAQAWPGEAGVGSLSFTATST